MFGIACISPLLLPVASFIVCLYCALILCASDTRVKHQLITLF